MKDPVTPLAAVMLAIAAASFPQAQAEEAATGKTTLPPVVVELFTSQGCSSCPQADVVLSELKANADILALSFHVTYWDRLGWTDTFGLEASTERQRDYVELLGSATLYTPQMVIGGRVDVVGSQRGRVREAIALLAAHREPGPSLAIDGSVLQLGAGGPGDAAVWLFGVDREHEVWIQRGENRGRVVRYHNVVREISALGQWSGEPLELELPLQRLTDQGRDGVAIVVQDPDGDILAADMIELHEKSAR